MDKLKVGSLFAGIGGFDLGLERTGGFETVWFVESDPFCQAVLKKHWPGVLQFSDVCDVSAKGDDGSLKSVDVLVGGFPCQDISIAGKGEGITGSRSGLWAEFARLIGELRPQYVVVENVPALASRGLDRVLADLAALGLDAEWDHLPASAFGAPHRRDRIWIVAYPNGGGQQERGERDGAAAQPGLEASQWHHANGSRPHVADSSRNGFSRSGLAWSGGDGSANGGGSVADSELKGFQGFSGSGFVGQGRETVLAACGDECAGGEYGLESDLGGVADELSPFLDRRGFQGWWKTEPPIPRVIEGRVNRGRRLKALGNALVPVIAEWIGNRILEYEEKV